MRGLFLLLVGAWLAPLIAVAQQPTCQQQFGSYVASGGAANLRFNGALAAISPDSAVLYRVSSPSGFVIGQSRQAGLVWVRRGSCDTARFASLAARRQEYQPARIVRTRRGQLRVLQTLAGPDSSRMQLYAFSRRGRLLWVRTYSSQLINGQARGILESPDGGTYISSDCVGSGYNRRTCLLRLDSLGRVQWRRIYASSRPNGANQDYSFDQLTYTARGNLLLVGTVWNTQGYGLVLEINQKGDSLTSREIIRNRPNTTSYLTGLRRLRDNGFLVTSRLDSGTIGGSGSTYCGFTRLDANLNVQWTCVYRPANSFVFAPTELSQGVELADGALVGVVNVYKMPTSLVRLLRLSATGQLLQTYDVPNNFFSGTAIAPLAADSSFVLSGASGTSGLATVMQLRIPGLRRVLAEPPLPATQVFLAARSPATFPAPAYPNPATESVTVPLLAGQPAGRLVLYDLAGRRVLAQPVAAGAAQARLPVGVVAAGTYLLRYEVPGQPPATQRLSIAP